MGVKNSQQNNFIFQNTFVDLPQNFFCKLDPTPVKKPDLIKINQVLADNLKLSKKYLCSKEGIQVLSGNLIPKGSVPLAMAYAGHQFGNWVPQLGDGRAIMLGELIDKNNLRYDIQLKGAGLTPFSRQGDGRASLGPVLREYIVSEAMNSLNIPSTRALAAVTTGEIVRREEDFPGAILTRVAKSHIRVGTFQYFAAKNDLNAVKKLTDYVINRIYPELKKKENPYVSFLKTLIKKQAFLISRWLGIGFIHGVMNTDNMTVSGETIDYGPCAFMDGYNENTVYSSIDYYGRYAYKNQISIAKWNLGCLASSILPLIDPDQKKSLSLAKQLIEEFDEIFMQYWSKELNSKLGLKEQSNEGIKLGSKLLDIMQNNSSDFTNTFRLLSNLSNTESALDENFKSLFSNKGSIDSWLSSWRREIKNEMIDEAYRKKSMLSSNPAYIPRNHRIEEVIKYALKGDLSYFHKFCMILANPFEEQSVNKDYLLPPKPDEVVSQTFCGT